MKLLLLTSYHPYDLSHGTGLILKNTLPALEQAGVDAKLAAILPDYYKAFGEDEYTRRRTVAWHWRGELTRKDYVRSLVPGRLNAAEQAFLTEVRRVTAGADVALWFGSAWDSLSYAVPAASLCPVVYHLSDSAALQEARRPNSRLRWLRCKLARRQEARFARSGYAGVICGARQDAEAFRELTPPDRRAHVVCIPNGINIDTFTFRKHVKMASPPRLLFTGNLDYGPNLHAIEYVIKRILPLLEFDLEFRIVGRRPGDECRRLAALDDRVTLVGPVEDIVRHYHQCDAFLAPIAWATGTKNKLLEALACGLPVFTLGETVEFLDEPLSGLNLGDGPAAIAAMIRRFAAAPESFWVEAARGRSDLESRMTWPRRTVRVLGALRTMLAQR